MRQQTEVSSRGYDAAKAADDAYRWLAYGRPQEPGGYEMPLRDRASRQWQAPRPQFRPSAVPGQRPAATPPHLAPVTPPVGVRAASGLVADGRTAERRAADRRLALAVALVFLGLFCLVGAWWVHTANAGRHTPGSTSTSSTAG